MCSLKLVKKKSIGPTHILQKSESIRVDKIIEPFSPSVHSPINRDDHENASGSHRSTANFQPVNLISPQIINNLEVKENEKYKEGEGECEEEAEAEENLKINSLKAPDQDNYEMDEDYSQEGIEENIDFNQNDSGSESRDTEMF